MSTSPISLLSVPAQTQDQSRSQQIRQDFKKLAKSLQTGDLADAQQAYSALRQLLPKQVQNGRPSSSTSNPISSDFNALGQALQSGDLSAAQSSFSQLQDDLKSQGQSGTASSTTMTQGVRGHHHHHHASSAQDSDSNSSSSSSSTITTDSSGYSGSSGRILNTLA